MKSINQRSNPEGFKMSEIKLLIVDDEKRFLETTQNLMKKKGINTSTATRGLEALEFLKNNPVDVVVLDIKMPGIDGIRTLQKIKEKYPEVEVIMLTGHATVKNAVKGVKIGAFDYLMKPCDFSIMFEKVNEAFAKKQKPNNQLINNNN